MSGLYRRIEEPERQFAATATSLGAGDIVQLGGRWFKTVAKIAGAKSFSPPRDPFPSCNR